MRLFDGYGVTYLAGISGIYESGIAILTERRLYGYFITFTNTIEDPALFEKLLKRPDHGGLVFTIYYGNKIYLALHNFLFARSKIKITARQIIKEKTRR